MTGPGRTREESASAAEAAAWFVRLSSADATAEEWRAFQEWLRSSQANVDAYERLERLSVDLDVFANQISQALGPAQPVRPARKRGRGPAAAWAALAGAGAMAAAATVAFWPQMRPAPGQVYQTPAGAIQQVALADGTRVRLNAASRMVVRLTANSRSVEMGDGEAAFDVAHDPERPFLIQVGDRQIRVVGTEFDLRHRDQALQLTVRRGVVEVSPHAGGPAVRLGVGQQLTHRHGESVSDVSRVDPEEAFGWTVGQLVYHDQPLSFVAADLGRRFGTTVKADADVAPQRFSGVIVADSEAHAFARLEAFAGVRAEPTPGGVLLRRADRP